VHLIHPYGLICFLSHFEFTDALLLHVLTMLLFFSVHGFFRLVHYSDGEAFHFAKFILL
jgi:hypothetical protein